MIIAPRDLRAMEVPRVPGGRVGMHRDDDEDDEDGDAWGLNGSSTPAATTSKHSPSSSSVTASTSHAGSAFAGGSKIAFDPRDLIDQEDEDARQGGRAPKLTIMEEVLLLGLKDQQVCVLLSRPRL